MDSTRLDPEVAARLVRAVRLRLDWVGQLRRRMEVRGFPPTDPLYQSVARCYDALQELHVRSHYASCTTGVGMPPPPRSAVAPDSSCDTTDARDNHP